jgi:hypothetical protein
MANFTISLTAEQASLIIWAIEHLPKSTTEDAHESKSRQLFDLYEKLHLFADGAQG